MVNANLVAGFSMGNEPIQVMGKGQVILPAFCMDIPIQVKVLNYKRV